MRGEDRMSVQYDFTSMVTIAQYIAQLPIRPGASSIYLCERGKKV